MSKRNKDHGELPLEKLQYINAKRPLSHRILDYTETDSQGYSPTPHRQSMWLTNPIHFDLYNVDTPAVKKDLTGTVIVKYASGSGRGSRPIYEKNEWVSGKLISKKLFQAVSIEYIKKHDKYITNTDIKYLEKRQAEYEEIEKQYKEQLKKEKEQLKTYNKAVKRNV